MISTVDKNSDITFEDIINDILPHDNVMFSVRSSGAVCEVNAEKNLLLRVREQYATIGDESRSWHIHVNLNNTKEARFVIENKSDDRKSYSIRFFDLEGNLVLRANFIKMYDSSNALIREKYLAYEQIFSKYGKKQSLFLKTR
ncbi:MAG: ChuX/HutX family heme-like substrate-binding protein [Nitrososphaeraceae archaeon]